jgi:hypothetical protein
VTKHLRKINLTGSLFWPILSEASVLMAASVPGCSESVVKQNYLIERVSSSHGGQKAKREKETEGPI